MFQCQTVLQYSKVGRTLVQKSLHRVGILLKGIARRIRLSREWAEYIICKWCEEKLKLEGVMITMSL